MSARPLTTTLLRQTAKALGIGTNFPEGNILQNREIGLAFQDFALWSVNGNPYANTTPKPSPQRRTVTGIRSVIPDFIGTFRVLYGLTWIDYPESSFQEVKAVKGVMTLDYPAQKFQMLGFVDVADRSPLALRTFTWPSISFFTTADTFIGPDVLLDATSRGVQIHQRRASLLPGGYMRMDYEVPLNSTPSGVIGGTNSLPFIHLLPGRIGRLGEHPGAGPALNDPDPLPDPDALQ
jgi:hypothetical protein